jgi:hypothetical protein
MIALTPSPLKVLRRACSNFLKDDVSILYASMKIIGYSPVNRALLMAPDLNEVDISESISLVLKKRGCAGQWKKGKYYPCDSEEAPFCPKCRGPPDPCVTCRGECQKPAKTCNVEHSVYLAVFSPGLVKVGVSKTRRLETRLMEQGADMGVEVARFPDGELARQRERSLAAAYPDRVTFESKVDGISQNVKGETLQALFRRYDAARIMRFTYFREAPAMKPIVIVPHENMALAGRVLGIKGQVLVIEKGSTLYALNLDGLVGYEVAEGKGTISLQTSLFEYAEG